MPELPEVETTVRAIRPFENTILKKIVIHNRNLRWQVDENLEDLVANKKIITITRRAIHSYSLFKVFIDASPRHVWKIKNSK